MSKAPVIQPLKLKWRDRILLKSVEFLGPLLIRAWGATWRVNWLNKELEQELRQKYGAVIFAFWHNQMLVGAYTFRQSRARILISQSKDGEFIARTVAGLGFVPVRGSTTRGGVAALKALVTEGKAGHDLSISPDGPRGPRHCAQIGVVLLARLTGLPILPIGFQAARRKELNSWDRFCLPYPGSRIVALYGEPIFVSPETTGPELEAKRLVVENALREAQLQADQLATGQPVLSTISKPVN